MVVIGDLKKEQVYYTCPCGSRIKLSGYPMHATSDTHLKYNRQMLYKYKTFKPLWSTKDILNRYPIYRAFVIMKYSK